MGSKTHKLSFCVIQQVNWFTSSVVGMKEQYTHPEGNTVTPPTGLDTQTQTRYVNATTGQL